MTGYRYRLERVWDPTLHILGWIMLNPSTADETVDDPTIRKCVGFAKRNGYGAIRVGNLFPARATKPADLQLVADLGDGHVDQKRALAWVWEGAAVVLAWGAWGERWPFAWRAAMVPGLGRDIVDKALHLGQTKGNQPRHPLMVSYATPLTRLADHGRLADAVRSPVTFPSVF